MNIFIRFAIASSFVVLAAPSVAVRASTQGEGVVAFGGQIVESACGLEADDANQIIEMPPEPIGRLLRNGEGEPHPFQLRLINCTLSRPDPSRPGQSLPDWQHVRLMFDGDQDRGGLSFAAFGDSQGVAFQLMDALGHVSIPGVHMPPQPLANGDMTLNYTVRLIGNELPLAAGSHSAAVRFKMEYY